MGKGGANNNLVRILLLALAAHRKWEVHHMDVKSAFLNGDLSEEVYVQQPPGFIMNKDPSKVLKLRKALYVFLSRGKTLRGQLSLLSQTLPLAITEEDRDEHRGFCAACN